MLIYSPSLEMPLGFLGGKRYIFAVCIYVFSHSYILVSFNSIVLLYPCFYSEVVYCWPSTIVFLSNFPFVFQFWLHILTKYFEVIWHVTIHSLIMDFIFFQYRIPFCIRCFLYWILLCLTLNIALSSLHFLMLVPLFCF